MARKRAAKKRAKKEEKPAKQRRFYIAHPKISDPKDTWAKPTLAAALKHAEEHLATHPDVDHVLIVKVIRRVRRQPMPLVIDCLE